MIKQNVLVACFVWVGVFCASWAIAEDGMAELDKAMELKVKAKTLNELSEVVSLCEQAIEKGLQPSDEEFAIRLLTGSLYQRSKAQADLLVQAQPFPPQLEPRRKAVLADLRKIVKYDDSIGPAHLMIAQLEGLPDGDREAARESIDTALKLLDGNKKSMAEALLVRAQLQEDEAVRIADFDEAVKLNPSDPKVWQTRAFYYLSQGETEKAVADFNSMLQLDGDNLAARLAVAETLMKLDRIDDAMKHVDKVIQQKPNRIALRMRAQLWVAQQRFDKALEDINEALKLEPDNLELVLLRARLYHFEDRNALARTDVDRVLEKYPNLEPALDLRSSILATMGDFLQAIQDINTLLEKEPGNVRYQLQLAIYQNAAGNSQKAIDIFTQVLEREPGNGVAFRGRADAYLNIGAHKEAVADYEVALETAVDDSGILNNYAWVLATSPDESLRDGKKALELGRKACELTDYKEAHILSTLAAAYAELGDFENAVKWSQKACEISDDSIKEQLEQELESYQQKKPWRENKEADEAKGEPAQDDGDDA